jgi:hypothetical protein
MPQKTNYAADAGRIAELQRDIRSGALSASALVVFPGASLRPSSASPSVGMGAWPRPA